MDVYHVIGNDLQLDADNDLALVFDTEETNQRLVRAFLTNKGSYFWNPDFGGSLPTYVGMSFSEEVRRKINASINTILFADADVAQDPAPEINIETNNSGLLYTIRYFNKSSSKQDTVSFAVPG